MKHPITMKLIAFHVVKAFDFHLPTCSLGQLVSESLLLMFAGKGVQSEVLIPILSEGGLGTDIQVAVDADDDVEGLVWVRLLTSDGKPARVRVGNRFLWESELPFSLN